MIDETSPDYAELQAEASSFGVAIQLARELPEVWAEMAALIAETARNSLFGVVIDLRSDALVSHDFLLIAADSVDLPALVTMCSRVADLLIAEDDMGAPDPEWIDVGEYRAIFITPPPHP